MLSFQAVLIALLATPTALAAPHAKLFTRGAPQSYTGPASNYPAMSSWVDFDTILSNNKANMIAAGDTEDDVKNIGTAVQSVASGQGLDPRVILALIVQESTGYVGIATTTNVDGQGTGGLMQTSGCQGYPGQNGLTVDQITTMVTCGVTHFAGNFKSQGGQDTTDTYYPALREFNSGSVVTSDLSVAPNGAGVTSYVSDISQRLQGTVF
ncbi:unnamed protein product [Discula destructiva]